MDEVETVDHLFVGCVVTRALLAGQFFDKVSLFNCSAVGRLWELSKLKGGTLRGTELMTIAPHGGLSGWSITSEFPKIRNTPLGDCWRSRANSDTCGTFIVSSTFFFLKKGPSYLILYLKFIILMNEIVACYLSLKKKRLIGIYYSQDKINIIHKTKHG